MVGAGACSKKSRKWPPVRPRCATDMSGDDGNRDDDGGGWREGVAHSLLLFAAMGWLVVVQFED